MNEAANTGVIYWLGVFGGSLAVGVAFGLIALCIGAAAGELKAARQVFLACVVVSLVGGLKLVAPMFVPMLWPIYKARKETKQRLAKSSASSIGVPNEPGR